MKNNGEKQPVVRYSDAFKMLVVWELEAGGTTLEQIREKYGIGHCDTIQNWIGQYGNGNTNLGKIIRVETPEERNEKEQLKRRIKYLEKALADSNVELALERQLTRLACQRAGIKDVAEFKKKVDGQLPTEP